MTDFQISIKKKYTQLGYSSIKQYTHRRKICLFVFLEGLKSWRGWRWGYAFGRHLKLHEDIFVEIISSRIKIKFSWLIGYYLGLQYISFVLPCSTIKQMSNFIKFSRIKSVWSKSYIYEQSLLKTYSKNFFFLFFRK